MNMKQAQWTLKRACSRNVNALNVARGYVYFSDSPRQDAGQTDGPRAGGAVYHIRGTRAVPVCHPTELKSQEVAAHRAEISAGSGTGSCL